MSFDYTGFKLGEKKALKEKEHFHADALKKIQAKLGADWKLTIDWPAFHKWTNEDAPKDAAKRDRQYLPAVVYERYCQTIGDELAKWGADIVEAVNESVKDHEIVITLDENFVDARYTVKVGDKIVVAVQQERLTFTYPYDSNTTVTAVVEKSL